MAFRSAAKAKQSKLFQPAPRQDIQVVEENLKGKDYIIGDIHGCNRELLTVLRLLTKEDRLFIVGDLFDRGPDSFGVYQTIQERNQQREKEGLPPQIYVARGNHENEFIKFHLRKSKYQAEQATQVPLNPRLRAYRERLQVYKDAEAAGLTKTDENYYKKLWDELVKDNKHLKAEKEKYTAGRNLYLANTKTYLGPGMGGGWADELSNKQRAEIATFIKKFPYIIHVKGKKPFNVVHADLPFSYQELLEKIKAKDFELSLKQREYATLARAAEGTEVSIEPRKEDPSCPPTYCGHSVCGGVRPETQHYNLDAGTFHAANMLLACHQENSVDIVVFDPNEEFNEVFYEKVLEARTGLHENLAAKGAEAEMETSPSEPEISTPATSNTPPNSPTNKSSGPG